MIAGVLGVVIGLLSMLMLGIIQGGGIALVILAIVIAGWVRYARTMRSSVLTVREEDYIQATRALGSSKMRIMIQHLLPNAIPPILVVAAVDFGAVIMLEATLSFLGVGVPINKPSLGMVISLGKNYIYAGKWWLIVFPGMALVAIVFGINLLSDWLREEINPRLKKG